VALLKYRIVIINPLHLHALHRCGLLLQILHVLLSVCWSHGWAVQKQLNWSRCHFGDSLMLTQGTLYDTSHHATIWHDSLYLPLPLLLVPLTPPSWGHCDDSHGCGSTSGVAVAWQWPPTTEWFCSIDDEIQIPHGKGHFWGDMDMCQVIVMCLCMSAFHIVSLSLLADMSAQHTWWTNAFPVTRSDKTLTWPFVKLLSTFCSVL